jgi:DNA-binding CsgD family transcriptional regulator
VPLRTGGASVPPSATPPSCSSSTPTATVASAPGLTRAESTSLAEIVKGDGLRAAAGRVGVSLATARTRLRHVFEKTGPRHRGTL